MSYPPSQYKVDRSPIHRSFIGAQVLALATSFSDLAFKKFKSGGTQDVH